MLSSGILILLTIILEIKIILQNIWRKVVVNVLINISPSGNFLIMLLPATFFFKIVRLLWRLWALMGQLCHICGTKIIVDFNDVFRKNNIFWNYLKEKCKPAPKSRNQPQNCQASLAAVGINRLKLGLCWHEPIMSVSCNVSLKLHYLFWNLWCGLWCWHRFSIWLEKWRSGSPPSIFFMCLVARSIESRISTVWPPAPRVWHLVELVVLT